MERFIKGDIVVIPFPYSDLSNAKKRPALVLAESSLGDLILCQITSQDFKDSYAVNLSSEDFSSGSLPKTSNIRPNKLFTADSKIILYKAGTLKSIKTNEVIDNIITILKN
ncbi:MAG TPA: type II toxin-antitoxin system PemK/MazF family toxin [Spirochaetota bacterium]|nr:type II toxin-antitoxin system PemK/MazF family toxin [Spirochaetota bacterium]